MVGGLGSSLLGVTRCETVKTLGLKIQDQQVRKCIIEYKYNNHIIINIRIMHVPATQKIQHKLKSQRPDTFLDFATAESLIMAAKSISRRMSDSVLMIAGLTSMP